MILTVSLEPSRHTTPPQRERPESGKAHENEHGWQGGRRSCVHLFIVSPLLIVSAIRRVPVGGQQRYCGVTYRAVQVAQDRERESEGRTSKSKRSSPTSAAAKASATATGTTAP